LGLQLLSSQLLPIIMMRPLVLLIYLIEYWGPKAPFHWPLGPTNQWGFELIDYGPLGSVNYNGV
ncbi:Hypothetical protein FKW44_014309, partial [Caligus rogercresseyi]